MPVILIGTLDTKGVGMLMRWGIEQGRRTRSKLKIGICGEHGGDADSVKFCHQVLYKLFPRSRTVSQTSRIDFE